MTVWVHRALARPNAGGAELALLAGLYGVYEVVRGFGGENWVAALRHTADIVALERAIGVYVERGVQEATHAVAGLPSVLGFAYIALHLLLTPAVLVWVYRARRPSFPLVRTTLIASTAIALVLYVVYPAAPPRLANLGFADTVSEHGGFDLSSDFLGSLYNPIAAVPSLHFGYALLVGAAVAWLARSRAIRVAGALYPALMLWIIVATGNHFVLDAAAGGVVVAVGFLLARRVVRNTDVRTAARRDARKPHGRRGTALTA
jgi:hypothetical protein